MEAEEVLRLVGSPDHVRSESSPKGRGYHQTEDWDYDFRVDGQWVTLNITWEKGDQKGRIVRFGESLAPWLHSDQRVAEILRY